MQLIVRPLVDDFKQLYINRLTSMTLSNLFFCSTFSMSDTSKDASTINAHDYESGSHEEEQNESDVEQHFKSGIFDKNNQSKAIQNYIDDF